MTERTEISIIPSIVPVGPRAGRLADQVFALHLSAAYRDGDSSPDPARELLPWNWRIEALTVLAARGPSGALQYGAFTAQLLTARDDQRAPLLADGAAETIKSWIDVTKSSLHWSREQEQERDEQSPVLSEDLAYLATFPGQVVQGLKLTHYFRLGAAIDVAGYELTEVEQIEQFIVAPRIDDFRPRIAPNAPFRFPDVDGKGEPLWWSVGWRYEDEHGNDDLRVAYVKPINVQRAASGASLQFDSEPFTVAASASDRYGLNFGDYWVRANNVQPWAFELEQRCQEAAQTAQRMAQATELVGHNDPVIREAWAKLRLMELARYSQWPAPSAMGAEGNRADQIIAALKQNFLPLAADEEERLRAALRALREALTGEHALALQTWSALLARATGKTDLTLLTLPEVVGEHAQLADELLLAQWDFALARSEPEGSSLLQRWRAQLQSKDFRLFFTDPAEKEFNWGARKLAAQETNRLLQAILALKTTAAAARDALRDGLLALRERLDVIARPDYAPHLISRDEVGAARWGLLWDGVLEDGVPRGGWAGAVRTYLAQAWDGMVDAPSAEKTPGGLTLQLDDAVADDGAPPVSDADAWRKVAGVGLLVREQEGQARWRIVSAATLRRRAINVKTVYRLADDPPNVVRAEITVSAHAPLGAYNLTVGAETGAHIFTVTDAESPDSATSGKLTITPGGGPRGATPKLFITVAGADFTQRLPEIAFGLLLNGPALVSVRAPYRSLGNDDNAAHIRYPFITYNQRSLIAPSALGAAAEQSYAATDDHAPDNLDEVQAVYEYDSVLGAGQDDLKLVPLRFGRRYELAAFMLDTAGGLPAELSQPARPWVFRGDTGGVNGNLPLGVAQAFRCLRRVPVGQVRISQPATVDWQTLPEACVPLSRELTPGADTLDALGPRQSMQPLVLLARASDKDALVPPSFSFGVRPPTVDREVLERWRIETIPQAPPFAAVLRDHLKRMRLNEELRKEVDEDGKPKLHLPDEATDLSLDDPAVTSYLFVLEHYDWEELRWRYADAKVVPQARQADATGIRFFQSPWLAVQCQSGAASALALSEGRVTVTVAQEVATVARLRVCALVAKRFIAEATTGEAEERFPAGFFTPAQLDLEEAATPKLPPELSDYVCLAPFTLLLETVNAEMPAPEALWQTLRARVAAAEKSSVRLYLTPNPAQPELTSLQAQLRNVSRCDLIKQAWRWQGRPLAPLPFTPADWPDDAAARDEDEKLLLWEASAFAEIDDQFDTLTIPLRYAPAFPRPQADATPLYEDRLAQDTRAVYLHYAVRAYSRYEALFPQRRTAVLSAQPAPHSLASSAASAARLSGPGWRRAFLPYRGNRQAKPVLKAIVPLTQAYEEASGAHSPVSPLLVVLDETMFVLCGITESIEARIESVTLAGDTAIACGPEQTPHRELYQFGRDPILSVASTQCDTPQLPPLVGPFGHTFDTDARQSLFSSSSFLLPPYAGCQPWDFAKLRLRRLTGNAAIDAATAAPSEEDWTKPLWVQFPPAASFGLNLSSVEAQRAPVNAAVNEITLVCRNAVLPAQLEQFRQLVNERQYRFFTFGVILTRRIYDFRSQPDYEVYLAAATAHLRLSDTSRDTVITFTTRADLADTELQARLVEVQELPAITEAEIAQRRQAQRRDNEFWQRLLDDQRIGQDLADAQARITRVSPRFPIKLGA